MATQLADTAPVGGRRSRTETTTPQARRLLEGPVMSAILRLAAPTVTLMLLQAVIAAGEAAFVGRSIAGAGDAMTKSRPSRAPVG